MSALKTKAWPWLVLAGVLVAVGLLVLDGAAGSIIFAVGLVTAFGGCVRFISRNDAPRDTPRVPAGHSGV